MTNEMDRLTAAKEKVENLTRKKERLSGVVETKKSRVEELEKKARKDFDCEVADIPDVVERLDAEATEALEKAEKLLNPPEKFNPCINEDGSRDEKTTRQMMAAIAVDELQKGDDEDDEDALPV